MTEDERRRASLALRDLARAFDLPAEWPVLIRKPNGQNAIAAGELVRRVERRYGQQAM